MNTKNFFLVVTLVVGLAWFGLPRVARADDANASLVFSTGSSCQPLVNGQTSAFMDVIPGQSANITFANSSSYSVQVDVQQTGTSDFTQTIGPGTSQYPTYGGGLTTAPVNGNVTVSFIPSCGSNSSYYYIEAAEANLTCQLAGAQWNLSGNYSNVETGGGIANGATVVKSFSNDPNATNAFNFDVAASSTSAEMIFVDGLNYQHGGGLANATCPAYVASTAGTSSTPVSSKSVSQPSTTKPTTSPTIAPTTSSSTTTSPSTSPSTPAPVTVVQTPKPKSSVVTIQATNTSFFDNHKGLTVAIILIALLTIGYIGSVLMLIMKTQAFAYNYIKAPFYSAKSVLLKLTKQKKQR